MSSEPAPADSGWDGDPAWLDQDPMTAEEREAWLDRLCELDEPAEEEYEDLDPLSPGELAGIREAAADEMLAARAAMTRPAARPDQTRADLRAHRSQSSPSAASCSAASAKRLWQASISASAARRSAQASVWTDLPGSIAL